MAVSKNDFDYIVVGAGSAGCVVANRLSADPSVRVALIEAGPSDRRFPVNVKTALPVGNIFLLPHARYNWQHEFTGGKGVNGRSLICPRGKVMGGCSSVNGSVYIRGHSSDYDGWADQGNPGWGYDDVLKVFRQHENWHGGETAYHGAGGVLDVSRPMSPNPLSSAFVEAAREAGYLSNDDFNGAQQDGFGIYDLNQRRGVRLSSSRAFLHPVLYRPNLTVFSDTLVEGLRLQGTRVIGVTVVRNGERLELGASHEVVLSGGAVNTPQLLMLSGIGPEQELKRHGIHVNALLEGVGQNLQDHPTVYVSRENPSAESYAWSLKTMPRIVTSPLSYLIGRKGMLSSNAAEAGGFIRTLPGLQRPDVQMTFLVGLKGSARTIPREHGFMVLVQLLRPLSRGSLTLASANPADKPLMYPNFLEHPEDVSTLVRGLRLARKIFDSDRLRPYSGAEIEPGETVSSDAQLTSLARSQVSTAYHPVGTCKMGPGSDAMAVVDARLRVYGMQGLRIADASIMPNIIGGNTSAPSTMIGERAAAFILEDAGVQRMAA
ncbi:MAG: GMC family oxidoreductase N-terminal domain-containing protein [Burkholderiaceae bacterium]|nr:GMC family oxidoreductase N-terminal domain-containing protein [Burkholderiaceae bacterium]